jgi:hypothetical protein
MEPPPRRPEKDDIARAMPADFAAKLEGTGLLSSLSDRMDLVRAPVGQRVAEGKESVRTTAAPARTPTPPPAPTGRPWWQWLLGLLVLLLLLWWLWNLFGAREEVVTETEEVVVETPEPATVAAESALVVDGVDLGETLSTGLSDLQEALSGITDPASAEAALPRLTEVNETLGSLEGTVGNLSEAAQTQIGEIVGGALPGLQDTVSGLLENETIAGLLRPVLDGILARLAALAG